ncbi:uncharacterized protein A4U43_C08F6180 [Asparagus officinalis]|nr:uncharacterized protein A4U43_C08F6180 [Asparagus officinalis]
MLSSGALTRLPKFLCKLASEGSCALGDGVVKVIARIIGDRAECLVDFVESSCFNLKPDGLDMEKLASTNRRLMWDLALIPVNRAAPSTRQQ